MLKNLPDDVRTRTLDAVRNGTGKDKLGTRLESNETELVLVPTDGSEPQRLAKTGSMQAHKQSSLRRLHRGRAKQLSENLRSPGSRS
jgi:hypothetical protein